MEAISGLFTAAPPPAIGGSFGSGWAAAPPPPVHDGTFGGGTFDFDIGSILAPIGKAFGEIQSARDSAALMRANAAFEEQRARDERVMASVEQARSRKRNRAVLAAQRGTLSEAGALGGTGYGVLAQNAGELELDALTTKYNRDRSSDALAQGAGLKRFEAGQVQRSGYLAGLGGAMSAGKELLAGIGSRFDPLNVRVGARV